MPVEFDLGSAGIHPGTRGELRVIIAGFAVDGLAPHGGPEPEFTIDVDRHVVPVSTMIGAGWFAGL